MYTIAVMLILVGLLLLLLTNAGFLRLGKPREIGCDNTSWATSAFTSGAMASAADDLGMLFFWHRPRPLRPWDLAFLLSGAIIRE
jgi:hypothetical protein